MSKKNVTVNLPYSLLYNFSMLKCTWFNFEIIMRIKTRKGGVILNKKIKSEAADSLFDAVLCLKTREECYSFFEDLCTVNELLSLSQRFEVAAMLSQHKTYLEITEKTGASTATISRVNRALNYGNDGYEMVLNRLESTSRIPEAE